MQGTVKFFHENRGWGFLTSEDKDYFVHYSQIKMTGRKFLSSDDIVNFDISAPDENGKVQAGEHGLTFLDLAAFAGFDIEGLLV